MKPAEAKKFLMGLLSNTDFTLTLEEAGKLVHSYKWLFDLQIDEGQQPIIKDDVIKKGK